MGEAEAIFILFWVLSSILALGLLVHNAKRDFGPYGGVSYGFFAFFTCICLIPVLGLAIMVFVWAIGRERKSRSPKRLFDTSKW